MESREIISVGDVYRHHKGNSYTIMAIAHHSETLEKMVVYQGNYTDETFGKSPIWVRPYDMFLEKVIVDGKEIPRFSLEN